MQVANKQRLKKISGFLLGGAVVFGILFLFYFISSSIYYDWSRSQDMAALQKALNQHYLDYKIFPVFAGILNGQDPVNSKLKKEKLIRGEIVEPQEGTGKFYYYHSEGKYYWINYCMSTNFFKAGRRGCNNQILVAQ